MQPAKRHDEVKAFFDRWRVYASIIRYDYMSHRKIHEALRRSLLSREAPFSVLDLGCGDASATAETLRGLSVRAYVGVDVSEGALEQASRTFAGADFDATLIQSDFSKYLTQTDGDLVDVVIAGFALHHLRNPEKSAFLADCFERMNEGGDLYVYDVFRRPGEDRQQYLESYATMIRTDWDEMSHEDREDVIEHILEYDFPATYVELSGYARETGFDPPLRPEFADEPKFHLLYRFTKPIRS